LYSALRSLELRIEQINNLADTVFYNAFYNAFFSTVNSAANNALDNAVNANFELFILNSCIIQDIIASKGPLFNRYMPMAYTDLWPL
jgi:ribosomal protein L22